MCSTSNIRVSPRCSTKRAFNTDRQKGAISNRDAGSARAVAARVARPRTTNSRIFEGMACLPFLWTAASPLQTCRQRDLPWRERAECLLPRALPSLREDAATSLKPFRRSGVQEHGRRYRRHPRPLLQTVLFSLLLSSRGGPFRTAHPDCSPP